LYDRWQKKIIQKSLSTRRVLVLSGSRQCGKTTLTHSLGINNDIYRTLDNKEFLESAKDDPLGFIRHQDTLMVIDEIQKAPELLSAIKMDVDQNQSYGRFLLTGSANIRSLPRATESLAGRVQNIRLRPLALGEIYASSPLFLENAFQEKFHTFSSAKENCPLYSKNDYIELALKGGYPEVLRLASFRDMQKWHRDYVNALIERDLRDIINIRRKDSMVKLLECLAAWSSKFIDLSQIGADLSIQRPTIEAYINALETLYLVERLPSWTKTDYGRVGRKDKLFMSDTGLMSSILHWSMEKIQFNGDMNGKLIETFVFNQLSSIIDAQDQTYQLYHYRDRLNREIDFLVENENGDYLGIEVKAGTSISAESFKHLKWFRDTLSTNNRFIGIILYTGETVLRFGEGMWAVPISALWVQSQLAF